MFQTEIFHHDSKIESKNLSVQCDEAAWLPVHQELVVEPEQELDV